MGGEGALGESSVGAFAGASDGCAAPEDDSSCGIPDRAEKREEIREGFSFSCAKAFSNAFGMRYGVTASSVFSLRERFIKTFLSYLRDADGPKGFSGGRFFSTFFQSASMSCGDWLTARSVSRSLHKSAFVKDGSEMPF